MARNVKRLRSVSFNPPSSPWCDVTSLRPEVTQEQLVRVMCVDLITKTVLKTFQTSSAPDFNDVFHRLEQDVIVAADMKGIKPEWPSVTSVLNLAANSFRRLKSTGEWDNMSGMQWDERSHPPTDGV